MALPINILQQVQTYQEAELAYLSNFCVFANLANKKFMQFQNFTAQLGTIINYSKPYRYRTVNSLKIQTEGTEQRIGTISVNEQASSAIAFSSQQFIYNTKDYMEAFGKGQIEELGTSIEANIAKVSEKNTYRAFLDGNNPINSFTQLAQAVANYKDYGSTKGHIYVVIPLNSSPQIIGSGLNQFALKRNNELAQSWELGSWSGVTFYTSNLLPYHVAGTIGQSGTTLTVVSTNDPTGSNITEITFSGAGTDANAIKKYDILTFQDNVSGQPNLRYLTFTGHFPSSQPVQVRANTDAASSGGNVTVSIFPALTSVQDRNQNILYNIQAGMKVKVANNHRCGYMTSGNSLFLAMAKLDDEVPYPTSVMKDENSGLEFRAYYGAMFGQNEKAYVKDAAWGWDAADEYQLRLCFTD